MPRYTSCAALTVPDDAQLIDNIISGNGYSSNAQVGRADNLVQWGPNKTLNSAPAFVTADQSEMVYDDVDDLDSDVRRLFGEATSYAGPDASTLTYYAARQNDGTLLLLLDARPDQAQYANLPAGSGGAFAGILWTYPT
jgi:hypothetical protein